jgi:hypothetical protein
MKEAKHIVVTMANRKNYYVARLLPGGIYSVVAYTTTEDTAKHIAKSLNAEAKS